jgi:DNA-binding transcriptional ArsR family regulator
MTAGRSTAAAAKAAFATHDDLVELRREFNQSMTRLATTIETALSDTRRETRDESRRLSELIDNAQHQDWGVVWAGLAVGVGLLALAATLIYTMITNVEETRQLASTMESETRTQIVARLDERADYERELSQYADELRKETQSEVVKRLETQIAQIETTAAAAVAASDQKSELRDGALESEIVELQKLVADLDTMVQREMRLLDEVLQRELKLNVERLDALVAVVTKRVDNIEATKGKTQ